MLSTELAENGSIHDYIYEKCKQPPLSQMLLWAAQVAEGTVTAVESYGTDIAERLLLL